MPRKKLSEEEVKIPHSIRLSREASIWLETRHSKTACIEGLVQSAMLKENSVYIIDLGNFNQSSQRQVLDKLITEGVIAKPATSVIKNGFGI